MRRLEIQAPILTSLSLHLGLGVTLFALTLPIRGEDPGFSASDLRRTPMVVITSQAPRSAPRFTPRTAPQRVAIGLSEGLPVSPPQASTNPSGFSSHQQLNRLATVLEKTIRRELHYPANLRRARRDGVVLLRIQLKREGTLNGKMIRGSGDHGLDRIALGALSRALEDESLRQNARQTAARTGRDVSFTLPVRFTLR